MDKERSIIVGVGGISLSTTDGENHTLIVITTGSANQPK